MSFRLKLLTGAAVVLLLGIGLCGTGVVLNPPGKPHPLADELSFLGFFVCIVSVLLLLAILFSYAVTGIVNLFRDKQ